MKKLAGRSEAVSRSVRDREAEGSIPSAPMLYIGKKAPKGFIELPHGIHLGKGVWMLRIVKSHE